MSARTFVAFIMLLAAGAPATHALDVAIEEPSIPRIDPRVSIITSGGLWQDSDRYGTCRIVVYGVGWEHVRSVEVAEWLLNDDTTREAGETVRKIFLVLGKPGTYRIKPGALPA